ncbi:MAG: type II toxin-antitoxin system HicA family toxin [Caldilineaceae bacterium]|nr:type II toxin-antitoxin system HicA family toxin [Caldilineaceae bacterium]MBP8107710.1 type II toxin-antitoxin system HicA family toxin [Caldilineaceae bacterium]MBP8122871.1 type II toxin-antitoxin system HicA family toxin [Caldilineaceae bacterium]MBP9071265.1 type II toxin-antitoxin system HicA family toxin [Caldilineaceae bacterium]
MLRQLGFVAVRQRGSHVFYRHPDGRTTTVHNCAQSRRSGFGPPIDSRNSARNRIVPGAIW